MASVWSSIADSAAFGLFPSKKQQFTVPRCVAKAPNKLHTTVVLQVLPGMFCYIPTDLQGFEVIKVCAPQLPETPGCGSVTLPRLSLQQEVLAEGSQSREQLQEPRISMV